MIPGALLSGWLMEDEDTDDSDGQNRTPEFPVRRSDSADGIDGRNRTLGCFGVRTDSPDSTDGRNCMEQENGGMEFRVLDFSAEGFTIRLPADWTLERLRGIARIRLQFLYTSGKRENFGAQLLTLTDFRVEEETEPFSDRELLAFCREFRLTTEDASYAEMAERLMMVYARYVHLRSEESDGEVSRRLTGYPAEEESCFASSWEAQRNAWMRRGTGMTERERNSWKQTFLVSGSEAAVALCYPEEQEAFLRMSRVEFLRRYWERYALKGHPLTEIPVTAVVFGHESCPLLLPEAERWRQLICRAEEQGLIPVIALPPLGEKQGERVCRDIVRCLEHDGGDNERTVTGETGREAVRENEGKAAGTARGEAAGENEGKAVGTARGEAAGENEGKTGESLMGENAGESERKAVREIVVNDWGTAVRLSESAPVKEGRATLTMGVHLQRNRRDVRLRWRNYSEAERQLLSDSAGHTEEYGNGLREHFRFTAVQRECTGCESVPLMSGMQEELVIPYMSMNTATWCTLRAWETTGDRGAQREAQSCPQYCRRDVFLYPDFLHMVGIGNTLFGYDDRILWDAGWLEDHLVPGTRRVILRLF